LLYRASIVEDSMDPSRKEGGSMSNVTTRRVATVVAAPLAALAAWGLLRAAGVHFVVSTGGGHVGAADVIVSATVAALLGWVVVRTLARRVERPRLWWLRIGSTCFGVSIVGPSWLAHDVDSVALMALHLVTALVIVFGLAATVPVRRRPTAGPETTAHLCGA
jgi:hypothetical protein